MTLREIITSVVTHIKPRLDSKLDKTDIIPVTNGGTGGTTKDGARQGIGIYSGTALPETTDGYAEGDIFLKYTVE